MKDYNHIEELESILDSHREQLDKLEELLDDFEKSQENYLRLRDYYGSEEFFSDMEDSNKGLIPEEIKCGILSEDEVYNLMGDNFNLAIRMLELATSIIKNH